MNAKIYQQPNDLMKRTKIVATLGPAITGKITTWEQFNDPNNCEVVHEAYRRARDILTHGVNVVRFNFSHGSCEEQSIRLKIVREVADELELNLGFMLDTKGPELRVGKFLNDEVLKICLGDTVTIYTTSYKPANVTKKELYVYDATMLYNMADDLKEGGKILIDDGKLCLIAVNVDAKNGKIVAKAQNSWDIVTNKRINLPGTNYSLPFLSDKDKQDIEFAISNDFDYIAMSFVNVARDVETIRGILQEKNALGKIQLISKIETYQAIKNIDEIIEVSDGIMIARGDLGLEIDFFDVPYWEKYIIKACRHAGKFSIVATQMLDSLERSLLPTRAEVTDVFFAVDRGTDATMLSGESANGKFPIQAVKIMAKINSSSEKIFDYKHSIDAYFPKTKFSQEIKIIAQKIAITCLPDISHSNQIKFPYQHIFIRTDDLTLIRCLSIIRPAANIIVLTTQKVIARMVSINYAIYVYVLQDGQIGDDIQFCQQIADENDLHDCGVFFNDKIYPLSKK